MKKRECPRCFADGRSVCPVADEPCTFCRFYHRACGTHAPVVLRAALEKAVKEIRKSGQTALAAELQASLDWARAATARRPRRSTTTASAA